MNTINPWGLSPRQFRAMKNLAEQGENKKVAKVMAISVRTVEEYLKASYARMGAGNRITAVLMFDRWDRE